LAQPFSALRFLSQKEENKMAVFRTGSAQSEEWRDFLEPNGIGLYSDFRGEVIAAINQEIAAGTYKESDWLVVLPASDLPSNNPSLYPALGGSGGAWSGLDYRNLFGGIADIIGAGTKGTAQILYGPDGKPVDGSTLPAGVTYTPPGGGSIPWAPILLVGGGLGLVLFLSRDKKED
jgi:hypothetical protein